MGSCSHTLRKVQNPDMIYNIAKETFISIHIKPESNVYIDVKRRRVVPQLKPLQNNGLYTKLKHKNDSS